MLVILLLKQPVGMAQSTNDLVNPQQKDGKQQWIYDRADLLDWGTEFSLNLRINKLVGRTSAELAIATSPKVETEQSPRAFAVKLFNALGIGKRETNNGVLLLVSKNDRRIEIITGKGLGEVLPDAEVSDLIQQKIVPSFQQQQYATGII
ncbi:MAG: TPM domain-containing protein, partial [Pseudanabaena sp.]